MSSKSVVKEESAFKDEALSEDGQYGGTMEHRGPIHERKLLAKIDLHILPILCILYVFAFIDRVNIGNALLFNLQQDVGMTSKQYNISLCVFFAAHVGLQIPANLLIKKVKPHIFMSIWFCNNYGGLVAIRFFLGAMEAGVFPGCFYIISMWYKRSEAQKRFTFFFNAASLAGAFGGLLASAIGHLHGKYGHNGWRWIFWVEGAMTCSLSVLAYFFISDFPETTKWLTEHERVYVIERLKEDQGDSDWEQPLSIRSALATFKDPKMVPVALMYFGPAVAGVGLMYFIPSIVATYGYSGTTAQLMTVPPWVSALVLSMIVAYFSDYLRHRFGFVIFGHVVALAGGITLFKLHKNPHAEYAAVCLYLMGTVCIVPLVIGWNVMNLRGHTKRAVGAAWQISVGNAAGFIAAWSFPKKDAPQYRLGFSLGIAFLSLSLTMSIIYWVMCKMENRKRQQKGQLLLFL